MSGSWTTSTRCSPGWNAPGSAVSAPGSGRLGSVGPSGATEGRRHPSRMDPRSDERDHRQRPWYLPMRARDADERHRVATPLELLFDLCFVVAVAQAAAGLDHAFVENHVATGIRQLPDGVLRHLVGLDELHLVRLRLRQRRRALPADGAGADRRVAGDGRRDPAVVRRRRHAGHRHRLRDHAAGHGDPMAAGGGRRTRPRREPPPCGTRPASTIVQFGWLLTLCGAVEPASSRYSWCWLLPSSRCRCSPSAAA